MTCVAGGRTDSGPRQINQDWLHWDLDLGIFVVADGMGGHNAGEVASHLAVETVMTFMEQSRDPRDLTWPFGLDPTQSMDANRLVTAVRLANRRVYREGAAHAAFNGMGTTLVCLLVTEDRATFVSVGDSRIYRVRRRSSAPAAPASSAPSASSATPPPPVSSASSAPSAPSASSAAPPSSVSSAPSASSAAPPSSVSSVPSAAPASPAPSVSSVPSAAPVAELLTRDDTWLAALVAADATCAAELATHPMRHVLTSVVGVGETLTPSVREERVEDGDCFLLCTDGVHGSVDVEALAGQLAGADTAEGAARTIVNLALENGTSDNVTALVVRIGVGKGDRRHFPALEHPRK